MRPGAVIVPAPRHGPLDDVGLSILARTDCETDMRAQGFADLHPPTRSSRPHIRLHGACPAAYSRWPSPADTLDREMYALRETVMLGKLSIIVAVAAVLMI